VQTKETISVGNWFVILHFGFQRSSEQSEAISWKYH